MLVVLSCSDDGGNADHINEPINEVVIDDYISEYINTGMRRKAFRGAIGSDADFTHNNPIIVNVTPSMIDEFSVGNAYFPTSTPTDAFILPITNNGTTKCFIRLIGIRFLNISDNLIVQANEYITGSTYFANNTLTSTCLATNETGYILSEDLGFTPSQINRITIDSIQSVTPEKNAEDLNWLPIGITNNHTDNNHFVITLQNYSNINDQLPALGNRFILFNSNDEPIFWERDLVGNRKSTLPGSTDTLEGSVRGFSGKSSKVEIFYANEQTIINNSPK